MVHSRTGAPRKVEPTVHNHEDRKIDRNVPVGVYKQRACLLWLKLESPAVVDSGGRDPAAKNPLFGLESGLRVDNFA